MAVNKASFIIKTWCLYGFLLLFLFAFDIKAQTNSPGIVQLDTDEFYIKLNSTIEKVILDVREEKDFKKERIPMAISAANQKVLVNMADTLNKEIALFIYCDFISRSLEAGKLLEKKGFTEMYILDDGFTGWKKKKFPVDKNRMNTNGN